MKRLLFACLLAVAGREVIAQDMLPVSGKVKDAVSGEPVEFATVVARKSSDSTVVQSVFTDSLGTFLMTVPKDTYFLYISLVGFEPLTTASFSEGKPLPAELLLRASSQVLEEVLVRGQKPAIERQPDRMIMNIAGNSIYKTAINALDVLKKAPGVRVSPDGAISLGNNITPKVFIDGKDVPMSGAELNNYLSTLEPDLIETIEIITSPSARYDSKYKAIVNIRLKRDKNLGWSGNYAASYRQHRFGDLTNNLTLTYKSRKAAVTAAGGYNTGKGFYQYDGTQNLFGDNSLDTYTDVVSKAASVPFRLGLDYFFNKNHSAGVTYRFYNREEIKDNKTDNFITRGNASVLQQTDQYSEPLDKSNSVNAYYSGKLGKSSLDYLGTAARYTSEEFQDIDTREAQQMTERLKSGIASRIDILSSQLDYRTPLLKGNFETGAKLAFTHTDNDVRFDILKENGFEKDPLRTNHFLYRERILAAYVNYAGAYKKITYQAGLRMENTDSDARSESTDNVTLRNYTHWLPTAVLGWKITDDKMLGLSFTSRLRRPYFEELNPFQFYISPFTYAEGNPFLLPERTDQLELTYSFKNYGITARTGRTGNNITQVPYYDPATFMTRYYRENLEKAVFHAVGFNGSNRIRKWWNVQYYGQVTAENSYYFINGKALDKYVLATYASGSQAFTLKNNWTIDHSMSYYAGGDAIYKVLPIWSMNFGVQKVVKNVVLKLSLDDVLNTGNQRIRSNSPDVIDTQFVQYYGSRKVRFQFIYRFGKSTYKARQTVRTDEENRAG